MTWITWGAKLATGHPVMDKDHEKLVGLINQLADSMENNKSREYCSGVLDKLVEHTRDHFAHEEQLMDRYRFPNEKGHKTLHATLLKDVLGFKALYDAGDTAEFVTLLVILDNWLNRDIMAADKALADFVAAAG